ncbi:putative undecaprenyl-phosphate N-acetylglucosaminyl 1-phosphate transferase [mine drainage metagenome]|uniref:Putative undecaprenyl-phosphate N-acetylglucosaminyl 1-phosphate transferase n=1 Tax=mine drainage metagenome TaxID=410659 RepID=A0A1J5RMF2_9ZZZZ
MSHYSPVVAALVTMLLTIIILISKFGKEIQDIPNERSLHETPVPRIGGVAMMAGLLTGWMLMLTSLKWWIVLPLIGLFIVSLLDDMHNLPVRKRLMAHLAAAAILVVGSGLLTQQGLLIGLLALLFTVWMTNLYNFMDGSDGLAGGMALIGFSMFGIAALISHDDTQAMLNFTVGAAALGFLYNNFHPAKIFLGDAGSIPLGFLSAGMGLWGWQQGYWAAWFPLLVFSPFIVDATVTLVKRTLRGVKVTEAHREHYYQRLIQMGWSHRSVALIEYGLMLGAGASAISALQQGDPWMLLLIWCGIYSVLMLVIDAAWRKFNRAQHA